MASKRIANLDFLRAIAISMVLVYHISQRWPGSPRWLRAITDFGEYGVDLFFVLSGWLIGGLLWRELASYGNVELGRFLARRSLRTMPPYFAALSLAFLGVLFLKEQAFDWKYLFFLQNYELKIPYFLVSWSLCVEEHFYLFAPSIAILATSFALRGHLVLVGLSLLPIIFRFCVSGDLPQPFGYYHTATHLRFDGLMLGVWAAFISLNRPFLWERLTQISKRCSLIMLVVVICLKSIFPEKNSYIWMPLCTALLFLFVLVALVGREPVSNTIFIRWIAKTSYSVYLTHAVMLEVGFRLINKFSYIPWELLCFSLFGMCFAFGSTFYVAVEVPSLRLRHKVMPNRSGGLSPLLSN